MKKVSIIVPVYNVEEYLEKCLNSLVNQTLKDIEIIVVNDGTKDNSQEIIEKFENKYSKLIKGYKKENGGLSSARNYGLKYATGEYIAFVDSDDYVKLNMYEEMYNYAIKNKLDIVVCDTIEKHNDYELTLKSNLSYSEDMIKNYIISYPMACTRLIKRNITSKVSFKLNTYYEDLDLMPTLAMYTNKIGFMDKALYYYVQRENSIMHQNKIFTDKLLDIFSVLEDVELAFKNNNMYESYKNEIEYLYITHLLRSASLRFLNYKNAKEYLVKVNKEIKKKYPDWRKNCYYKKSSFKLKIICILAYKKMYLILKLIKRMSDK